MSFSLAEGFVNALKAYIEANLTAKLAALDAEYDDGIVLRPMKATLKGIKSLTLIPEYPVLYVVSPDQDVEPWNAYGDGSTVKSKPHVYAGVIELNTDQETLQLLLYRYARALTELLMEGLGEKGLSGWDIVGSFEIDTASSPLKTAEEGEATPFIGEITVGFRGQKTETK